MPKPEPAFDWDRLSSILGPSREDQPPSAAITTYDFAKQRNMAVSGAQSALRKLVLDGVMESGKFWDKGRGRWAKFFWIKERSK